MKNGISWLFLTSIGAALLLTGCASPKQSVNLSEMRMIDLSHIQDGKMPAAAEALQPPARSFFLRVDQGGTHNLEIVSYCPHTGTHMDSPFHVATDGITVEAMDPQLMIGPATVLQFDVSGAYTITRADITAWEAKNGAIPEGDGILIDTRHDRLWNKGKAEYIDNGWPILSQDAADYIVAKRARYVALEAISPEGDSTNIQ